MKWSEISLRDVGPIGQGAIGSDRAACSWAPITLASPSQLGLSTV